MLSQSVYANETHTYESITMLSRVRHIQHRALSMPRPKRYSIRLEYNHFNTFACMAGKTMAGLCLDKRSGATSPSRVGYTHVIPSSTCEMHSFTLKPSKATLLPLQTHQ